MGPGKRLIAVVATVACAALLVPAAAGATNIPVTIVSDTVAGDAQCSLREAVGAALSNDEGPSNDCAEGSSVAEDVIQLPAGTFEVNGPASENANAGGDFDLTFTATSNALTIDGTLGAGDVPQSIIDAEDVDRIFDVQSGDIPNLTIREVILRNGKPPEASSHGGAINVRDDNANFELNTARIEDSDALGWGGGMSVAGSDMATPAADVDVTQVEFSGNDAVDDGGGLWIKGPREFGTFVISRSAFIGNHSDQMGGGIYINADGVMPADGPVVEVADSTISGNTADATGGGFAFAFGDEGTLKLEFSTIAGNSTPTAGEAGGIDLQDGVDEFIFGGGNVLSGNTANGAPANCDDADGDVSQGTGGIESGPALCFPDATIGDPLLQPLSYNATGDLTTRTQALGAGSPAIDALDSGNCTGATDQRGVARPIGGGCDAGAFEAPLPTANPTPPAPTPTATKCKKKKKKKKRSLAGAAKKKKKKGCKKKKKKR